MFWIVLGIGLVGLIYVMLVKPFQYWLNKEVPQYRIWKIVLDTFLNMIPIRPIPITIQMLYNDFSDKRYIGTYQFSKPILLLRDPKLIYQITVKDFEYFVDHRNILEVEIEPLWERSLFMLCGDKWKDMRSTLSSSFTSSKLKTMFNLMVECSKQFVGYFKEQDSQIIELDIKQSFEKLTNDIIATTAFGISCNSMKNPNNTFYLMGKKITKFTGFISTLKLILVMLNPHLFKMLGLTIFDKKVTDFFKKIIHENISAREKDGIVRPDMINLLLEARKSRAVATQSDEAADELFTALSEAPNLNKDKKRPLADEDIMAQAMIFFIAGFDSVSITLSFMAYELAVNPNIQQRLYDEIADALQNGELTYEALTKMKYLDMVVSETLRKYPAGFLMDRVCVKPYTIQATREDEKPLHFRIGDVIGLPIHAIQRDSKYFPDPDLFDPERFSSENKPNITPHTFLTFGSGPRHCLGFRFAIMEIKLAFYYLLSSFEIVVVDKTPIPVKFAKNLIGGMSVEGGWWVGLKRRETKR